MARKKIEFSPEMINEVERLSGLGFNEAQISESLNISYSTFQRNKKCFEESLKKGKLHLRERVTNKLLERIDEDDTTMIIFTAKRLGLFQPTTAAIAPKTAKEAVTELSKVYELTANGLITPELSEKLTAIIQKVITGIEVSDLEERLIALEEGTK